MPAIWEPLITGLEPPYILMALFCTIVAACTQQVPIYLKLHCVSMIRLIWTCIFHYNEIVKAWVPVQGVMASC